MRTNSVGLGFLAAVACVAGIATYAPHAAAQPRSAQRCAAIDDDAERLACYDGALRPAPAAAPAPAAPSSRAATAKTPPPAATPSPAAVDPVAPAPSTTIATENRATRPAREVRNSAASAPPVAGNVDTSGIVPIVIVQVRALPGRAATFVTDTGDTWVQTDSQRVLPKPPFKAEIKPGSISSFFLVPEDFARSFRVRHGE